MATEKAKQSKGKSEQGDQEKEKPNQTARVNDKSTHKKEDVQHTKVKHDEAAAETHTAKAQDREHNQGKQTEDTRAESTDKAESKSKTNRSTSRSKTKTEGNIEPGKSARTTDHDTIRAWVEARGGMPAAVKATEKGGDPGMLRIDFPGYSGSGRLEEISWEEFFKKFDEKNLEFLYQEEKRDGETSRFWKFVAREDKK